MLRFMNDYCGSFRFIRYTLNITFEWKYSVFVDKYHCYFVGSRCIISSLIGMTVSSEHYIYSRNIFACLFRIFDWLSFNFANHVVCIRESIQNIGDALPIGWVKNLGFCRSSTIKYTELGALESLAIHRLNVTRAVTHLPMNLEYVEMSSSTEIN